MLAILLRYYRVRVSAYFATARGAKITTALLFFAAFGFLAFEVYVLFRFGFSFIARDPFLRDALLLYIIELFLLVSFVMVFASALAAGSQALLRAEGDDMIMSSPRYGLKPYLALSRMFLSSLWPLVAIIIPALCAIQATYALSALGMAIALASVFILVLLGVIFATLLILLIGGALRVMSLAHHTSFVSRRSVTLGSIIAFLMLLAATWERFRQVDLVTFFQARVLTLDVPDLTPLVEQFGIFPSHTSALAIFAAARGNMTLASHAFTSTLTLFVVAAMVFMIFARIHPVLWQLAQEGKRRTTPRSTFSLLSLSHAEGPLSALFGKEILTFVRDTRGMLWMGFVLLIWALAVGANHILVRGLGDERVASAESTGTFAMVAFASAVYFVAMTALRFAFPAFSIERKSGWLLGSAPLDQGAVYVAKLAFFMVIFVLLALGFGTIQTALVALPASAEIVLDIAIIVAVLFITVLALSLGAIYPNRDTDDPELLSTTAPGLAFIAASLLYGAFGAFAISRYLGKGDPIIITLALVVSVGGIVMLLSHARRALSRMEFS